MSDQPTFTAFDGDVCIATGALADVALRLASRDDPGPVQIFDDANGAIIEIDLRHGADRAVADYLARTRIAEAPPVAPGPRRPRLGVVAREVTLLPRHWDWLATQRGGASAALRRLVEEARRESEGPDRARRLQDATYRVMASLAGHLPGFEDASRALFAGDATRFHDLLEAWPEDVRCYVRRFADRT